METWTILSESAEDPQAATDPQQRIRPVLAGPGPAIAWLPGDGHVDSLAIAGLAIKIMNKGFRTLVDVPGENATLFVTDQRIVLVLPDVRPERGAGTWFADALTAGVATSVRDATRWTTGRMGMREKFHLVAQIDHLSLAMIRYYQASTWGARSLLNLAATTGEPAPRALEFVETSVSRKVSIQAVSYDIFRRARSAQERNPIRPLTGAQHHALAEASFRPSGDGHLASLAESCMPLSALALVSAECTRPHCHLAAGHAGPHRESPS